MSKIAINIVRYNQELALLEKCISAALSQDFDDFSVTLMENGSNDSLEAPILSRFGQSSSFHYLDNGRNLGFAGAHNVFFRRTDADFVLPLNPDAVLSPEYLRQLWKAFANPKVAAAEGKMLKPDPLPDGSWILDGTGMMISRSRRTRERGQLEIDRQQYDAHMDVFGVSGTAAAYRMSALQAVKFGEAEYFDEDFFTYWEDLDLSWRLRLAGFACSYVPDAIVYHTRFAGQSKRGIKRPLAFAKHIRSIPTRIVCWDWRNHLFAIIKNDFGVTFIRDLPLILAREISLFLYLSLVQPKVLLALPKFFSAAASYTSKAMGHAGARKATSSDARKWFSQY